MGKPGNINTDNSLHRLLKAFYSYGHAALALCSAAEQSAGTGAL